MDEANVRLVVVGCAPHKFIQGFRDLTKYPYEIYCDPDRLVYQALGLHYTLSAGPAAGSEHVKTGVLRGTLNSTWRTIKGGGLQGDFKQQGGSFVIATDGTVEFCHRDEGSLDHAPINDLLSKVGVAPVEFIKASA